MENNNQNTNSNNDIQPQSTNEINPQPTSINPEGKNNNISPQEENKSPEENNNISPQEENKSPEENNNISSQEDNKLPKIEENNNISSQEENKSPKIEENNNSNIKDKIPSQNENDKKDLNSENSQKKEEDKNKDVYIFNFDKDKISPCIIENIDKQEESQIFKIFINSTQSVSIKSDSLMLSKMSSKQEMQLSLEIPMQSYENNMLLSISKNPSMGKISISDENVDDFEKINKTYEKNKNVNLAAKSENDMICPKPKIILENKDNDVNFTFQEMMNYKNTLYGKTFTFDSNPLPKLNINNDNDIKDIFSNNNPIFASYTKKNIKIFQMNKKDEKEKKVKLLLNEENEEDNTISANNERRKNREKYTYKFQKPTTDSNKIRIENINLDIFDTIEQAYEKSNIKPFLIQNDSKSQKLNIDNDINDFITEIYCSYKPNEKKSPKINLDTNIFIEGKSIEDINTEYTNKYILNLDLNNNYNNYSEKNDIDVFDNIDFDIINKKYEKYKKSRTKKKDKYLCGGDASLQLIKDSLSQEIYNNSETSTLHKLSTQLKDIDDITDNDEIKNIIYNSDNLALNSKNIKCAKKLKNELNRSLMNKYIHNNKSMLVVSSNPKMISKSNSKDINSINSNKTVDNINKENNYYKKKMKNINKINNSVNEKEKKIYNNKLKIQQENIIEKEIKNEKKYKYIIPTLVVLVLLFNKVCDIYNSK